MDERDDPEQAQLSSQGASTDLGPRPHITHQETRHSVQQSYGQAEVTADDIAEVIAFTLSRPRRLAINEVLLRPAGQP